MCYCAFIRFAFACSWFTYTNTGWRLNKTNINIHFVQHLPFNRTMHNRTFNWKCFKFSIEFFVLSFCIKSFQFEFAEKKQETYFVPPFERVIGKNEQIYVGLKNVEKNWGRKAFQCLCTFQFHTYYKFQFII